ncbi:hypothetical protein QWY84_01485 [Aquisalimonas lutea]|uniref:hypothetical protein n=1 Tax=Aquisalimonas lutea TaxID=1327750 RepID=UPI0025B42BA7|nr:hypothetical protein [Aquisalimonas lutea]MDN3516272.1 hypothetical protein [Aquisalimonas lutea]
MTRPPNRPGRTSTKATATPFSLSRVLLVVALAAVIALAAGCSSRGLYEGSRPQRMQACERLPPSEQPECQRQADMPYREYERARDELEKDE